MQYVHLAILMFLRVLRRSRCSVETYRSTTILNMRRSSRLSTNAPSENPGPAKVSKASKQSSPSFAGTRKRARPTDESSKDGLDPGRSPSRKKTNPKSPDGSQHVKEEPDSKLAEKKWQSWAPTATSSPFPSFPHPTPADCEESHHVLHRKHQAAVDEEFSDPNTPETIAHVLDAMMVALLSAATSWSNAKRAMNSMKEVYGSVFAYDEIYADGKGRQKLEDTIKCGGLHVRKSTLIASMLQQVHERHGKWDIDHLFDATDEEAMKELLTYKGIGPKCAFVVMGWCLKRNPFTVDTHVFRIAGLWGWIPEKASREKAQAHLDAMVPKKLKFDLHFLLIAHGRTCPVCRGGSKSGDKCEARAEVKARLKARKES
jgi:endonuclease-3